MSGLFLIQFEDSLQAEWREQLSALGVELLRYVPDDAFIAQFNHVRPGQVRQLDFVRWVGDYRPEHKLHPSVLGRQPGRPAGEARAVRILFSPAARPAEMVEARRALQGVQRESRTRFGAILSATILPGRLEALARSPAVLWIEPAAKMKLFDEIASEIVCGDGGERLTLTQATGYDGAGVTVAVADSGLHNGDTNTMHPDLFGRVTAFFQYGSLTNAADEHSHGTHVTGIIAGNGTVGETDEAGALYGLGVAPNARIVAQRLFDGEGAYEPPPSFETLTRDAVRSGAEIGSNSWGDDTQGQYDLSAAEFDELVRDADALTAGDQPYILEFSAGNAGPGAQTIGSPAVAKNVIATGASQNNRLEFFVYAEGQEAMADFSSRGPCEDGRIKPDLVAPGTWIASLKSESATDDNAWATISDRYLYQGGTSQAGPHVSGGAALFVQYYRELFANTPSPAMVKAALINSAIDMDNAVETEPVPNMDEGWGRLDLIELLLPSRVFDFVDQTQLLQTGQTYERRLVVTGSDELLKITLAYTDVPGFPGAVPALVNDLDLEVEAPDGTIYRGNQFEQGESIASASSIDRINNVEGVHLLEPLPGEYIVRVRAHKVVQDSRRDTGPVDQDFALVISGHVSPPGLSIVFFDRSAYTVPGQIRIKVIDSDAAAQSSANVTLRSTTEAGGFNVTLLPTGIPGAFTGSVTTATGPAVNDGQLQIAHGDLIQADYFDLSAQATRTAMAKADLLPPVLSNVTATSAFGKTIVTWDTDEEANSVVHLGTNSNLGRSVTNRLFVEEHKVTLDGLIPGRTYFFLVSSSDMAGNTATNNNVGSFVAPEPPTVLLVNAYFEDECTIPIPLSTYTDALSQIGVTYDVWDIQSGAPSPTLNDLSPYRVVIWRLSDSICSVDTLTSAERNTIQQYLNAGGSFLMASMEQLTRLGNSAFRRDVLHVVDFSEDIGVPSVSGVTGNPITSGMNLALDYSAYHTEFHDLLEIPDDLADTITPSTNATLILEESSGEIAGLSYPRVGQSALGRVVFLGFPLDAVPASGADPNNRASLLRNIIRFLAPGERGVGDIVLDNSEYTIPSTATVEVADSDLTGQGTATVRFTSDTQPAGQVVTVNETTRLGLFRGAISLVASSSGGGPGQLRVQNGDTIRAEYFDASSGTITATAIIETNAPMISAVSSNADYVDAFISWQTSGAADSLVQFGESISALDQSVYDARLRTSHDVTLSGLKPDTLYYFRVISRDRAGNTALDDNQGQFHAFRTLRPVTSPWFDNLEQGAAGWQVQDSDSSEGTWQWGPPQNGTGPAHSPANAWGSNLRGEPVQLVETFLISPAIYLTEGDVATLRFWHKYDFTDELSVELAFVELITNISMAPIVLGEVSGLSSGWEEAEYDLTPHIGKVVYVVWHYALFSFGDPRPGWLVDDVSIMINQILPPAIVITNTISQATFALEGPISQAGQGQQLVLPNAPLGQYSITFGDVPHYQTPAPQTNTLSFATLVFQGNYTFTDSNNNGMSDSWEQQEFNSVSPDRTRQTDTDQDGFTDYAEFIAGTNPNSITSTLQLTAPITLSDGSVHLQWPAVPGRAYRVEGSNDGSFWEPVSGWIRAESGSATFTLLAPNLGGPYLFRLEVRP